MYAPLTRPRSFQPIPMSGVRLLCGMLVLWLFALLLPRALVLPLPPGAAQPMSALPDLQSLPLAFTPNLGQTDPAVRFFVRGATGNLFFTPDEVVLTLPTATTALPAWSPQSTRLAALSQVASSAAEPMGVLRTRFDGANPQTAVAGATGLPGMVSELVGDVARPTALATYSEIVYQQLYPGIDLRYHGAGNQLRSVYSVAPRSDPAAIRWHYDGITGVELLDATGDLQIRLSNAATLTAFAPRAWQMIDGQRVPVDVRYRVLGATPAAGVGFALGSYNPAVALMIEPAVDHAVNLFSTFMGGSGVDIGTVLALDPAGNIYITGATSSLDFPVAGALQGAYAGGAQDGFIVKLSPDGKTVLYSTYLGGSGADTSYALAVDAQGYAYVAGFTNSPNFPAINAAQSTYGGGRVDAFLVKLSPDGGTIIYSTYLGGSLSDVGFTVAADPTGAAYLSGVTTSPDLPLARAFQSTLNSPNGDLYVARFGPEGELVYSTYLGGNGYDETNGLTVDADGHAYVVGFTGSSDFPLVNPAQTTFDGVGDLFVLKLTPDGQDLVYSTYLGGTGNDLGTGIAIDAAGQAVVTGATVTRNYPTVNALQPASHGSWDAIVTRLSADGRTILYSSYLGGSGPDFGFRPAVGRDGSIYITGRTSSANFPRRNPLQRAFAGGESDAFITRLSPNGQHVTFSTYLGGKGADEGASIVVDRMGSVYVVGRTGSADFPLKNAVQGQYGGGDRDMFITKIGNVCVQLNPAQLCRTGFQR